MKILNFGSLNVDYAYELEHFVQPGETISSDKLTINAGGKGLNQSIALAKSGAAPFHAGAISIADRYMLKGLLDENGVNTDHVRLLSGPSGHAIIQVEISGHNCIILYGGANQQIDKDFVDNVLDNFSTGDIVLLQNEISAIGYIMELAHQKGMKIYLNPSPANSKLSEYPLQYVDTLILNEVEGEQLTGETAADSILDSLLARYPEMKLVLTLGEQGAVYSDKHKRLRQEIFRSKVVDTTAAGDTFTGYFIGSIAKGMSIEASLKYASAAASIAVSRLGAACSIPDYEEVEALLAPADR